MNQKFKHVVFFWLKPAITEADKSAFESGVRKLSSIQSLAEFHLGIPAPTDRSVIDKSYDYCLICTFESQANHDSYQEDPIHDIFRETCAVYWGKVLIYDSVEVA